MEKKSTIIILLFIYGVGLSPVIAQNIIWSEDFSGGQIPTNWTNIDASSQLTTVWEWTTSTPAIMTYSFGSPTATNGFVTFNSDAAGALPNNHDVKLTTSVIDCSALSTVVVCFSNQYAYDILPSQTWLGVSTDGVTFTYFSILTDVLSDKLTVTEQIEEVDISSVAAGQPTVYLQFRWLSNWQYVWSIDDIRVQDMFTPPLSNNLSITDYLLPNAHQIPIRQLDTLFFAATIENIGLNTQTKVQAMVDVKNDMNQIIFSDSITIDSIQPNTIVDTIFNNILLPHGLQKGEYTLSYFVTQDSIDDDTTDNIVDFNFIISDTTFAIDDGTVFRPFAGGLGALNAGTYGVANYYYLPNDSSIATSVTFAVQNAYDVVNETIDIFLYQVDVDGDGDLDNNNDNTFNSLDVNNHIIGFANYTFTGFEGVGELITVPLENFINPTNEISLVKDGSYLVYFQYNGSNLMLLSVTSPINYNNIGSIGVNVTQDFWALGGLPDGFLAVLRLNIADLGTPTKTILSKNSLTITPNPTSDFLNVAVNLEKVSKNVMIKLTNIHGTTVQEYYFKTAQKETIRYNTQDLSSGVYFISILTEYGNHTEKVIILK